MKDMRAFLTLSDNREMY